MKQPKNQGSYNLRYLLSICFVATLGGMMFGFDAGIIIGVLPYVEHQYDLSGFNLGLLVAIFSLGAAGGAIGIARAANKYGRKKIMIVCAFLFCITTIGISYANGVLFLAIWRCAQGVCIGISSVVSPMYIAEITPARDRGKMVSLYQLSVTFGMLLSTISSFYFGKNDLTSLNWRFMFLSGLVLAAANLVLLFFIPESPRWLVLHSKNEEEANRIFLRINRYDEARSSQEIIEIRNSVSKDNPHSRVAFKVLFGKAFLSIVLIGIGIALLSSFCGINNVIPYMQKIFILAGIQLTNGLLNAVFVQMVFFLSTFIGIALIDRVGRRVLMLTGTGLMAITLFLLAWVFQSDSSSGVFILVLVMLFIGSFGFTLGPVGFVLISEMFPNEIRSRAIGLTAAIGTLTTFCVMLISPYLLNIGAAFNFVLFGLFNIAGFIFCLKFLPETKGKTLEQMNEVWKKK